MKFLTLALGPTPELGAAWPLCPEPWRWACYDGQGVEVEVLEFLETLVVLLKPPLIVETGTYLGWSAAALARGCWRNGVGHVVSYECDPHRARTARAFLMEEKLEPWVTVLTEDSKEGRPKGPIDLLFVDGSDERVEEIEHYLPWLSERAVVVAHDGANAQHGWRRLADRFERVLLPTPRGLWLMQRRPSLDVR